MMLRSFALLFAGSLAALAQSPCDKLKSLTFPDATITAIESVAAGPYQAPGRGPAGPPAAQAVQAAPPAGAAGRSAPGAGRGAAPAAGRGAAPAAAPITLPAYCRAALTLAPSTDSHIEMEIWLPATGWNGKFEAIGNGGWAGTITFATMARALQEGYATASNDTGHKANEAGGNANFSIGHPDKLVDFAYRAVHEMTVKSKAIITSYYGKAPKLSYWNGCSTGGRQGLMEAQKYPDDFDGIVAGAPANYQIHLHTYDMNVATLVRKDKDHPVPAVKLAVVNKAVLDACDAMDGVKDHLLTDPRRCTFDPAMLLCKGADSSDCLTAAQVESVKTVYAPVRKKNGEVIYPGMPEGGELGWGMLSGTGGPPGVSLGSFIATYQDVNWDWKQFDPDRETAAADEKIGFINAVNPDLKAFKAHGGKLILYHGWNDQLISPNNSVNYYSSVLTKMGAKQDNFIRLFMVPGMQHCQGGPGPNQFNYMGAMERWREGNTAPDSMLASHVTGNNVDMSRPLCPYPQTAQYKGVGSTNDAASFACKVP